MTAANSPQDLSGMVAAASGRATVVAAWVRALRRAGVEVVVADCCAVADHAEVWIRPDQAESARAVLRESDGGRLIW